MTLYPTAFDDLATDSARTRLALPRAVEAIQTRLGITPATPIHVATTGNDTTGTGAVGAPYLTIAKALSRIPQWLDKDYTIDIADGTYAEGIDISRFSSSPDFVLKLEGNAATPTNVLITGAVSSIEVPPSGESTSAVALVRGPIHVELEGITLRSDGTAVNGLAVLAGGRCIFDRSRVDTSAGTYTRAVRVQHYATVEFQGNVTLEDWSFDGLAVMYRSTANYTSAGTLTITGPGTTGTGVRLTDSNFLIFGGHPTGLNITITGVLVGFNCGFNSSFTHQAATATITIDNASKPANSSGVLTTDHSNWSTTQAVVMDNFTNAFEANSISYIEATGSRTITNVDDGDAPTQNSVIHLP